MIKSYRDFRAMNASEVLANLPITVMSDGTPLFKIVTIQDDTQATVPVQIDTQPIPLYNPSIHRAGDTVMLKGKVVTIPELDADGHPIPQ
jgi:hypothetical protein